MAIPTSLNPLGTTLGSVTITIDDYVTQSSSNPVKSSGIYLALTQKQDKLTISTTLMNDNSIPTGSAIYAALGNRTSIVFDDTPVEDSINGITSGWAYQHKTDTIVHLTAQDRTDFNHINSLFHQVIPPGTVIAPEDAIPDEWFASYFSRNAQPGMMVAPGNVFVSRVPFAQQNADGSWRNKESSVPITTDGYTMDDVKLLDNRGLVHKCSTNVTENTDDYVGKKWAFYWARCNYKRDEYGVKWITAVEGETIGLDNGNTAVFDETKPIGVFGPAIWTFCTLDTSDTSINPTDGKPDFQLWGIGDSPWDALSTDRKNALLELGVDSSKYQPWSTGLWYDYNDNAWKRRSYIVDSAYCGTAEVGADGTLTGISSKYNQPVCGGLSHNLINTKVGKNGGEGARAIALAIMFDIVKNATKNSQTIHYGMAQNNNSGVVSAANTLNPGYLFPIASKGNFEVGCTVYLTNSSVSSAGGTSYVRKVTNQIGRIVAIENRSIEVITSDPTVEPVTTETQTKLCLVIDEDTVNPFYARTTTAYAKALTDENTYACAYATQGIALAGETKMVIGKHDGYVSGTNGRHPYRVQGMEMMCGVYQCAVDCVPVQGNGSTSVTLPDGTTSTPTSSQYVYMYLPTIYMGSRRTSGTLQNYKDSHYIPVGIGPKTGGYIFNGFVDPHYGVWYYTHIGASTSTGHADNSYAGASPAEYLSGGYLNLGADAGSAFLFLTNGLDLSRWYIGARD